MSTDKNAHLDCVLNSHKIGNEEKLLNKHIERRTNITEALLEKYRGDIYSPFNSGSYAKNTAVNKKFDFDLIAPFKRNAFDTLEEMYNDVFDFLYEKYKDEATIRKQKVSIGLEFNIDADAHTVKIDVVPGRELNQEQYEEDNKLNLYVFENYGSIVKGSDRIRSNVKAQIDNIRDRATKEKDSIRKIIRLLKVWKIYNGKTPKSFLIELITIKAFDQTTITGSIWDKLKAVIEYIKDNIKAIALPDPGNSANDVADTLTEIDKSMMSDDMKYMLERIEENSDNIKSYFKVNEKFPCEDKKEGNEYGQKKKGVTLPPPARFG